MSTTEQFIKLDDEWVTLILIAKRVGLTPEEVRDFLFINSKGYDTQDVGSHTP